MLSGEPAVLVGLVVLVLNGVQAAALDITPGWHTVIGAVIVFLGALTTRSVVTPVND